MDDHTDECQSPRQLEPPPAPALEPRLPPAVDAAELDGLRALQMPGMLDIRDRVIGLYLEQTPLQLGEMEAALNSHDTSALRRAAHTIKSSSANVGAGRLSALCGELESVSGARDAVDLRSRVEAIEGEFGRARQELETFMQRGSS